MKKTGGVKSRATVPLKAVKRKVSFRIFKFFLLQSPNMQNEI
jgi:hypothetical protein